MKVFVPVIVFIVAMWFLFVPPVNAAIIVQSLPLAGVRIINTPYTPVHATTTLAIADAPSIQMAKTAPVIVSDYDMKVSALIEQIKTLTVILNALKARKV